MIAQASSHSYQLSASDPQSAKSLSLPPFPHLK